jgi:uncharacterized protein YegL
MEYAVFIVLAILAVFLVASIFLARTDMRRRYRNYVDMLPDGAPVRTFDEWKANMNRVKTDHNRYPSDGSGASSF